MKEFVQKYWKWLLGLALVCVIIYIAGSKAREDILANSTESKLPNPERKETIYKDTFYYDQLSDREKKAYDFMTERLEKYEGGVIFLPEALNGQEYVRVTNAIEYGEKDYFYGFFEIPMTENNICVTYGGREISSVKEPLISQCILFLSCSNGLNEQGSFSDTGLVVNLEEMDVLLQSNDLSKLQEVKETEENAKAALHKIVDEIPEGYGQKEIMDYFLTWLQENMNYAVDAQEEMAAAQTMEDLFLVYPYSSRISVLNKKALSTGYVKVFSHLCNMAGIPSYVVFGTLSRGGEAYEMSAVEIGDELIYVDASGNYASRIGGLRYLSKEEGTTHMRFNQYFSYPGDSW